ncbi:hypothetical protein Sar04_26740 [Salinispora arenicola]|uniref:Uncharacterized protein n=1 Tax=Salinispora arenicola TaxID=168697 RepID=A0ABQ4JSK7_SALAC|nr:hypothetical protein Sar04_26740 [Salinispora arenicola]
MVRYKTDMAGAGARWREPDFRHATQSAELADCGVDSGRYGTCTIHPSPGGSPRGRPALKHHLPAT